MNDLKYPVKYAVLELRDQEGIYAYIASKCYLIDRNDFGYQVLFPFTNVDKYHELVNQGYKKNKIWEYDPVDFNNLMTVFQVFNNYEDARKLAHGMNVKYRYKALSNIQWEHGAYSELLFDTYRKLNEKLALAKRMEAYITSHTGSMEISGEEKNYSKKLKK